MGRTRAVSLCVALVFGSVFSVAISSWEEQGARKAGKQSGTNQQVTSQSPNSREPEFLADQSQTSPSGVEPASYEQPQPDPLATAIPGVMPEEGLPAVSPPADETPADASEAPAPVADVAQETPAEETPAETAPADAMPAKEGPVAEEAPAEPAPATPGSATEAAAEEAAPNFAWHDNYGQAMDAAIETQRMLLVFFYDREHPEPQIAFEKESLASEKNRELLARGFVAVKLPTDTVITSGGKDVTLLRHPAFVEMVGRPGVAVLDFAHPHKDYFGRVVSTFPFVKGRYYSRPVLSAVLDLPAGTLTQRTMIYAVRIHPESPASTQGQFNGVLAEEANRHSQHQAEILVQGHHNWGMRVQRISARVPNMSDAQEVVAESWPQENLVEACINCVDSWRHSPGHWQAVRSRHPLFGFDIQRGRNGIWYATGIFGHR